MSFITRNNMRLYYLDEGQGETLLMLQGVGVPACGWSPQITALKEHYRIIAPDNRGIGQSEIDKRPLSIETMAEDARAILDTEGIRKVHVIGHSMGGVLAQQLALDIPERIQSLSLLCTFFRAKHAAKLSPWKMWVGIRCHLGTRAMRRRAFVEMVLPPAERSVAERDALAAKVGTVFGRDLADQPSVAMRQLKAMGRHDCSEELGALKHIPSLVISGAYDRIAPPSENEALAHALEAEYECWKDAAHGLPITQASHVNERLLSHLRG